MEYRSISREMEIYQQRKTEFTKSLDSAWEHSGDKNNKYCKRLRKEKGFCFAWEALVKIRSDS